MFKKLILASIVIIGGSSVYATLCGTDAECQQQHLNAVSSHKKAINKHRLAVNTHHPAVNSHRKAVLSHYAAVNTYNKNKKKHIAAVSNHLNLVKKHLNYVQNHYAVVKSHYHAVKNHYQLVYDHYQKLKHIKLTGNSQLALNELHKPLPFANNNIAADIPTDSPGVNKTRTPLLLADNNVSIPKHHVVNDPPKDPPLATHPPVPVRKQLSRQDYNVDPPPGHLYVGLSLGDRTNYSGARAIYKGIETVFSLGYGGIVAPCFYLAGEVYGGDSFDLKDYSTTNTLKSIRTTWGYGFDAIPGFMITNNVMGYLRLGVVRSHFNNLQANSTGFKVGAGAQTPLTQNLELRADYTFSRYNSVNGIGKPITDQANLGIVYKFY